MKKISNLLIGTNNKGKLKEIRALLPKYIRTYSTSDFNLKSPIENGKTFEDNSIIKSKYFSKKTRLPCLADDSGLEIDLLNKAPGIHSARWGGKNLNFKKAITKVYKELDKKDKNWRTRKIKARFVCVLSISFLRFSRDLPMLLSGNLTINLLLKIKFHLLRSINSISFTNNKISG